MSRFLASLTLLCAFVAMPALAQYAVSGIVRDTSLQPVAGVRIVLADGIGTPIGIPLTLTNAAGSYSISPLPSGDYIVGFEPPTITRLLAIRAPISVAGANLTLNQILAAGVLLSGTVTDGSGAPIPNIDLKLQNRGTNEVLYTPGDNTDVTGFYDLIIPTGEFDITWRAVALGALPWIDVLRREIVTADTIINIQMVLGVFVSGHVTRTGGFPVAEANLDFIDAATGLKLDTPGDVTDLAGFYQVHVPPASYDIRVKPAFVDRLLGIEMIDVLVTVDQTLDIALAPGVGITGTVSVSGGGAEANVAIELRNAQGVRQYLPFAVTDLAGTYAIVLPAASIVTLDFLPEVATKHAPVRVGPVMFSADQVVNLTVHPGIWLSGTITDAVAAGIPGVNLDLKHAATGLPVPVRDDITGALGAFQMTVLPGNYILEVEPAVTTGLVAQRILAAVATDTNLPITLMTGARVYGTVSSAASVGIPDYRLEAFDLGAGVVIFTPTAVSDALGTWQTILPVPRNYRLRFLPGPNSGVSNIVTLENQFLTGETQIPIQLPAPTAAQAPRVRPLGALRIQPNPFNPRTAIHFELQAAALVDLRVYDASGALIRTLAARQFDVGAHSVRWDGRDDDGHTIASGVYFCRLRAANESVVGKLVFVE